MFLHDCLLACDISSVRTLAFIKGTPSQNLNEILKVSVFSRSLLEQNYMRTSILIKTYCFQEIVIIKKQNNAKSVTDASIWVMFIS